MMDKVDLKLIGLLQKNARMPLKQLAEYVFLSPPAVASRIKKLEQDGVIKGYEARVDLVKLNYPITAFISLAMLPKQKPLFYSFINTCPNVLECNCVTGNYSMLIKVTHRSTQELDAFVGKLQRFGSTLTQVVFSTQVEHHGINVSSDPAPSEAVPDTRDSKGKHVQAT